MAYFPALDRPYVPPLPAAPVYPLLLHPGRPADPCAEPWGTGDTIFLMVVLSLLAALVAYLWREIREAP